MRPPYVAVPTVRWSLVVMRQTTTSGATEVSPLHLASAPQWRCFVAAGEVGEVVAEVDLTGPLRATLTMPAKVRAKVVAREYVSECPIMLMSQTRMGMERMTMRQMDFHRGGSPEKQLRGARHPRLPITHLMHLGARHLRLPLPVPTAGHRRHLRRLPLRWRVRAGGLRCSSRPTTWEVGARLPWTHYRPR